MSRGRLRRFRNRPGPHGQAEQWKEVISVDKNGKKLVLAVAAPLARTAGQRWAQHRGAQRWEAALVGVLAAVLATALIQQVL
ncbi:hypothetical protein EDD39_7485 [Kitasatospora cineracea]|uniref:Uncharacterized protein n=1 Tax=Kitasatospora cineracea TaxID=88074 RepID=A0A8G1XBW7_9ACTN|nr:hypothetical protein EDD39_7485 [Kitasatospora cineracea]